MTGDPVISLHLADHDWKSTLRRRAPRGGVIPGLRSSWAMTAAPFTGKSVPRLQLERGGLLSFWEDLDALKDFNEWHPASVPFRQGVVFTFNPRWASGAWPGLSAPRLSQPLPQRSPEGLRSVTPLSSDSTDAAEPPREVAGLTAALTLGVPRIRRLAEFSRRNVQVERQLLKAPGFVWGTGLASMSGRLVTVSLWRSTAAMRAFGRAGAHGAAVDASPLPDAPKGAPRYDAGTRFFRTAAFVRCSVAEVEGHLAGENPQPALVA